MSNALGDGGPATADAGDVVRSELFEPATEAPCDIGKPNLRAVMEEQIGPALSKLSFHLHHDKSPPDARMESILAQSATLIGCARVAASFPPKSRAQHAPHFYAQLELMRQDAVSMQQSTLMGNEQATQHWFEHLRARCDTCHAFFIPQSDP